MLPQGQDEAINLISAVTDGDNLSALVVSTAVSANPSVVRARVSGTDLVIEAVAPGRATVELTSDSNGKSVTTSFTVTVTRASIPGDVNMDGEVNISDVIQLVNVLLGSVLADYDPAAADLNRDGEINISDAVLLINKILNEE